ncbi:ribosome recycling factor [Patescibacteria group bacterium]|nr:ribosome recycling factor [Patescibacteria group bacterium]
MDAKVLDQRLRAAVDNLKTEFQTIRSGRPSPRMVEDIKVEVYGQHLPVKGLGSISVVPPKEIDITLWDISIVGAVSKAVEDALKVTASTDGALIRVNLPSLTEERKKEFEKVIKKLTEETRIRIRGIRDEANKDVKQEEADKKISEDFAFKEKEGIQKKIDATNKEIETITGSKLKEIMD